MRKTKILNEQREEWCSLTNCCYLLLPVKSNIRFHLFLFLVLSFLHPSLRLFFFSGPFEKVSLFLFSDFLFHFWIVLKCLNPLWTFYFFTIQTLPEGKKINIDMWEILNIFKSVNPLNCRLILIDYLLYKIKNNTFQTSIALYKL